ncbi:MAG TPA: hypothetical protein VD999_00675 [Vitreimonas sp.]|nr:hypothetical protein [Vitreimonas sp.]
MRVLQTIFISLLFLAVAAGVGFLVAREAFLIWGVATVRESVTQMRRISVNSGIYLQQCKEKGISDLNQEIIGSIQLRFESSNTYVIEVVCAQFPLSPITVTTKKLPMFVTKIPGAAGIIWGENRSGVGLTVWGRSRAIVVENREVTYQPISANEPGELGFSPVSSCSGYGFTCCALDNSLGQGNQLTGVSDCPRSCYQQCQVRPQVLSVTTQPFYDPATRQVIVAAGESLEINYVVDTLSQELKEVTVEYGDGTSETFTTKTGTANHTYSCFEAKCEFQASVKVTDRTGTESPLTHLSSVKVVVTAASTTQ